MVCAPWSRDEINIETFTLGTSLAKATVSAQNLGIPIDHALKIDVHIFLETMPINDGST